MKESSKVYVIGCKLHNVCKIGVSVDPNARLKSIQTGYPWPLSIWRVFEVKDAYAGERRLHQAFADWRLNGEWFYGQVFERVSTILLGEPVSSIKDLCRVYRDFDGDKYDYLAEISDAFYTPDLLSMQPGSFDRWSWVASYLKQYETESGGEKGTAANIATRWFVAVPDFVAKQF
jgi:hypothetical protein